MMALLVLVSPATPPVFNNSKCPSFRELQVPLNNQITDALLTSTRSPTPVVSPTLLCASCAGGARRHDV